MRKWILSSFMFMFSLGALANHHRDHHGKKHQSERNVKFFGTFGYGFVSVMQHNSQWGNEGTDFNYVTKGGQEILFPNLRAEAGVFISKRHKMSLLYQPIFVTTEVTLEEELKVDGVTFDAGKNLIATYDFPFYRFSYWYLLARSKHFDFWLGAGVQIRNANIRFKTDNGSQSFRDGNVGPVPLINHGVMQSRSLLQAGILFQSKRYRRKAEKRLLISFKRDFS